VLADAAVISGVDAGGAEEAGADVGGDDDVSAVEDVLGEADADVVGVGFGAEDVARPGSETKRRTSSARGRGRARRLRRALGR
jgi:hypothetical protein